MMPMEQDQRTRGQQGKSVMRRFIAGLSSIGGSFAVWAVAGALMTAVLNPLTLLPAFADSSSRQELIPILGVTMGEQAVGIVVYLVLSFEERLDHSGLMIRFQNSPVRFSPMAQTSTDQAIRRVAQVLGLSTDLWSVTLAVPYAGTTIHGESLSAMVGVSVAAMARGYSVPSNLAMTGTITPEGAIGSVGEVPLKVMAAGQAQMHRVLVPDQTDFADADWTSPFLVQVSPVHTVEQALALFLRSPTQFGGLE